MNILENYLQNLQERRTSVPDNAILYHGSKVQGLKVIDPKAWIDALRKSHEETVWASWDKSFASMFCIDWRYNIKNIAIGTELGYYSHDAPDELGCIGDRELDKKSGRDWCVEAYDNDRWAVVIPTRYKKLIMQPCSLYKVQAEKWIVPKQDSQYDWSWPEAYSKQPAKVLKEKRYNTVKEAYEDNGVKLFIRNSWRNSRWWNRMFSKLKI